MGDPQNLLLIWTDQQATNTMAAYGNQRISTPNLNWLSERSYVFKKAYVSQPICTSSRSTILTGLYPHQTGITENNIPLRSSTKCLPEFVDLEDYETGFHGKWHLGDEVFSQHGFNEWRGIEDGYREFYSSDLDEMTHSSYHRYLAKNGFKPDKNKGGFKMFSREFCAKLPERYSKPAYLAQEACRFLQENQGSPFMLSVMFLEPHWPYFGPRDNQYNHSDVELPPNFGHEITEEFHLRSRLLRTAINDGYGHLGTDITQGEPPIERDWLEVISNYWGLVSLIDTQIGKIFETLENCGLLDDTIIVFTSDHGDMMGSHKLIGKRTMFEEAIKVPLLLKIPGQAGRDIKHPVSQIDLVPTLLDLLDQPACDRLDGFSWMPFLQEEGELEEKNVFVQWNGPSTGFGTSQRRPKILDIWERFASKDEIVDACLDPIRTVITPQGWKLNYSQEGNHELYNLSEDPHETCNLATQERSSEKITELTQVIKQWQQRTRDPIYL